MAAGLVLLLVLWWHGDGPKLLIALSASLVRWGWPFSHAGSCAEISCLY